MAFAFDKFLMIKETAEGIKEQKTGFLAASSSLVWEVCYPLSIIEERTNDQRGTALTHDHTGARKFSWRIYLQRTEGI